MMIHFSGERDYWPTKEWRVAEPASLGMDPEQLHLLENMVRTRYRNLNGILVVRKGYAAYEKYFNGYGSADCHHVASVTKSFTSAAVGLALDGGFLESVDQKVFDFFPEHAPPEEDIRKRAVTIQHLLTMTAPFAWTGGTARGMEPLDRLRRQQDWVEYILDLLGRNGPIGKFQYCTAGTHLLSAIITRATGSSLREFANVRLFRPLGIREIPDHEMKSYGQDDVFGKNVTGWVKDPRGITAGGWGLTISLRDMARFGFLYLNRGQWEDRQILPGSWVDDSTVLREPGHGYGYLWWLRNESGLRLYSALGSGGNVICCIPDKDLVVAIASGIIARPRDRWELIEKCILPAITDG